MSSQGRNLKEDHERRYGPERPADSRASGQRDRDRVLYSDSFQRLAHLAPLPATAAMTPRITHTLKAAQVARRLAERFTLSNQSIDIDADMVEAASLAHDVGYAPFGETGANELDSLLRERSTDGFNRRAQAFRTVTKLELRRLDSPGLNLTRGTLKAMLSDSNKFAYPSSEARPAEYYSTERGDAAFAHDGPWPNLPAELVEWAHDVVQGVYGLVSFVKAAIDPMVSVYGLPSTLLRVADSPVVHRLAIDPDSLGDAIDFLTPLLVGLERRAGGKRRDHVTVHAFASALLTRYIDGAHSIRDHAYVPQECRAEVALLNGLVVELALKSSSEWQREFGFRRVVRDIFLALEQSTAESRLGRLPDHVREFVLFALNDDERYGSGGSGSARGLADFISSLTDHEALGIHQRLCGL